MLSIEVYNVCKAYREFGKNSQNVLENLNLVIKRGTIYSLVGASGCGKTTFLNCLLGIQKIKKGEIKIFNEKVKFQRISKFTKLIGYMPQQISLASQLSISETFNYFACLQQINEKTFKERFEMMFELLCLPSKDSLIGKMSSGQQRRVSFAIAILHDPELLILDEPTVGVDFELRERIWNFLHQQSNERNLTILFTTQYLSETARAHYCGFLRNGKLIVENSHDKILEHYNVQNIDEAFYKICCIDEHQKTLNVIETEEIIKIEKYAVIPKNSNQNSNGIRYQVFKGLLTKEWQRVKKNPSEIFISYILPVIYMLLFIYTIGGFPDDLRFGIINHETAQCENYTFSHHYDQCFDEKISCEILRNFKNVIQVHYALQQQAYEDLNKGKIFGIITIDAKFSKNLENFYNNYNIITDPSNYPFYGYHDHDFYSVVEAVIKNISSMCEMNIMTSGITIELDYQQEKENMMKNLSVVMTLILTFCSMMLHSVLFIYEFRSEGFWNRSIINGMKISEILSTYLLQFVCSSTIITIEMILLLLFVVKLKILGSLWLTCLIIFLMGIDGCLFGLIISILFDSFHVITGFVVLLMVSSMSLSGILWPIEGASYFIQLMRYVYPLTLPGIAIREIVFKRSDLSQLNIQFYFFVLTMNILFHIILSLLTLKWRKLT